MRATGSSAASSKPSKRRSTKREDRSVPFEEMRRIMRVYGSCKCLRKRKGKIPGAEGSEHAKVMSVKRRFYRWFPDFQARFERVQPGEGAAPSYRPRGGHEFEMNYRAERRREDGELLVQKRVRGRHGKQYCSTQLVTQVRPPAVVHDKPDVVHELPVIDHGSPAPTVWSATSTASHSSTMARRVTLLLPGELPPLPPDLLGAALGMPDRPQLDLPTDGLLPDGAASAGFFDEVEDSFYSGVEDALDDSAASAMAEVLHSWTSDGTVAAPDMSRAVTDGLVRMTEVLCKPRSMTDVTDTLSSASSDSPALSHSSWDDEDDAWNLRCDSDVVLFGDPIEDAIEGRASILDDVALPDIDDGDWRV